MDSIPQKSKISRSHLVWEDDEDESLCGLDVSDSPWVTTGYKIYLCPDCKHVNTLIETFISFNQTYDEKTSLHAAFQAIADGVL